MPKNYPSIWNDDNIEEMSRLLFEGHTASEIGRIMGIARNAIIGKCYRLGMSIGQINGRRKQKNIKPKPKTPKARIRPGYIYVKDHIKKSIVIKVELPKPPVQVKRVRAKRYQCTLAKLNAFTCRWPLWGPADPFEQQYYCAGVCQPGSPYCEEHHIVAYTREKREPSASLVMRRRAAKSAKSMAA